MLTSIRFLISDCLLQSAIRIPQSTHPVRFSFPVFFAQRSTSAKT